MRSRLNLEALRVVVPVGLAEETHLLEGDCLLSSCSLCRAITTDLSAPLVRALDMERGKAYWLRHRRELMTAWTRRLDELDAPSTLPAFAQCLFEGAKLPDAKPSWSERVKFLHHQIDANLSALRAWRASGAGR